MSHAADWRSNSAVGARGGVCRAVWRLLRDAVLERQTLSDDLRSLLSVMLRTAVQGMLHLLRWCPRPDQPDLGYLLAVVTGASGLLPEKQCGLRASYAAEVGWAVPTSTTHCGGHSPPYIFWTKLPRAMQASSVLCSSKAITLAADGFLPGFYWPIGTSDLHSPHRSRLKAW